MRDAYWESWYILESRSFIHSNTFPVQDEEYTYHDFLQMHLTEEIWD